MKLFAFTLALLFILQSLILPACDAGKGGNKIIIQRPKHHCCCEHEHGHGHSDFDWGFGGFGDFGGLGGGFGGGFRR